MQVLLINIYFMMKHPILQKSHGSIPTGSCGKLSLAGSICRSLHLVMGEVFTRAGSLDSLHAHLGCLLLVFGAAVVMAIYEQDTTEGTHLLRKFPDICTAKEKNKFIFRHILEGFCKPRLGLYLPELHCWCSARPACSGRSNAQGQVFSVFGMQPCSVYSSKIPQSLAWVRM